MDDRNDNEFDIEVSLDESGELKFSRGYDYLPYTPDRIKRILKDCFNAELENKILFRPIPLLDKRLTKPQNALFVGVVHFKL